MLYTNAAHGFLFQHHEQFAADVNGFVERALAFFHDHDIEPKRLISDNAWTYTHNRALAQLLNGHGIRHLLIPPHRPQVNGKVERYQQTLKREWALGQIYRSSDHRAAALSHRLNHYGWKSSCWTVGGSFARVGWARVTAS